MKGNTKLEVNLKRIPISEIIKGYNEDEKYSRVTAMNGRLDIRPKYQREFVYSEEKQCNVIKTVLRNLPLGVMYFVDRKDGTYEVLDGQQRLISICKFALNRFNISSPSGMSRVENVTNFENLYEESKEIFNNYKLEIYICSGTDSEKIEWFKAINVPGEKLENQEILNAVLCSKWLTDAKVYFSRNNCPAYKNYRHYMKGSCVRQKYLETVFSWKAHDEGMKKENIVQYMTKHKKDTDAKELWKYFEKVFNWVKSNFKKYDKTMQGIDWGILYNEHKNDILDPEHLTKKVEELLKDGEVTRKSGIYEYLLTGNESTLSLRTFSPKEKTEMYNRQNGECAICKKFFPEEKMEADHIIPWVLGGKTEISNGQMLCMKCNRKKSSN